MFNCNANGAAAGSGCAPGRDGKQPFRHGPKCHSTGGFLLPCRRPLRRDARWFRWVRKERKKRARDNRLRRWLAGTENAREWAIDSPRRATSLSAAPLCIPLGASVIDVYYSPEASADTILRQVSCRQADWPTKGGLRYFVCTRGESCVFHPPALREIDYARLSVRGHNSATRRSISSRENALEYFPLPLSFPLKLRRTESNGYDKERLRQATMTIEFLKISENA